MKRYRGLTLIEVLVAIVVSLLTLGALYEAYISLLRTQKQQVKIAENNLQVLMALEYLRKDIELAGFGIPRSTSVTLNYNEANAYATCSPATYNTAPSGMPKPLDLGDNSCNNSDYLVIRSTAANLDKAVSRRWGYIYYDGGNWQRISLSAQDFSDADKCVVLDLNKTLVAWDVSCKNFNGNNTSMIYFLFGVNDGTLRMPFNRVDYYLRRPNSLPARCNPSTYELYRAEITHNGTRNEQPILDCVLAFQIVAGRDTNGNGTIDQWSKDLTTLSASDIFGQVKEINLYILYQEGPKSPTEVTENSTVRITYPDNTYDDIQVPSKYYRWKLIQMKVKPLNLEDFKL